MRDSTCAARVERLEGRTLMAAGAEGFRAAGSYAVGPSPEAVVTADFNNDGRPDLATANAGGNSVGVLLGDGAGGFGPARQFAVGANPVSIAAADLNEDGKPDLVTANRGSGDLSILPGTGDGTFGPATTRYAQYAPLAVAVCDFNADNHADLLVSEDDDNSFGALQVLRGNGMGGFAASEGHQVSSPSPGMAVADVDADGNLDVVTVNGPGGQNGWAVMGNGDGTFLQPDPWYYYEFVTGPDPRGVAVGDFTGDGNADLVVAAAGVEVLVGHGDGLFDLPVTHSANGASHTSVAVADFDGDGRLDAASSDSDAGTFSLMLGNGDGTLRYAGAFASGSSPTAVVVGDFNGDGRPDLAAANAGSNDVAVLLNDGSAPAPPPSLRISDATATEGNTGTANASFVLTLSRASDLDVTVHYDTADVTAAAGSDYAPASGNVTIPAGQTSRTFTVSVTGDRLAEPTETFAVQLRGPANAVVDDGTGICSVVDDEPRISIGDVSGFEGKAGRATLFTFTATLSAAYDQPVTTSFRTADGTARISDRDYIARAGTITFNPGETTKTITVEVRGDGRREGNETFYLDLLDNSSNSLIGRGRGAGLIWNDD